MLVTGDQQLVKQMNRMALVRALCREPALSRAGLAEQLGLTKSTVGLLVRELVDEGWLSESEIVTTGSLGRRPTPLHVDDERLALLGIDVGVDQALLVLTSLSGRPIAHSRVSYRDPRQAEDCLARVAAAAQKLVRQPVLATRRLLGVGVGLHGGVDEARGWLHVAPNLGWREVPVAELLGAAWRGSPLGALPLYLQNEADMAVLAAHEFAAPSAAGAGPLVYLSLGHGVGAGVVVRDTLLTGARGFAGEIGHTVLKPGGLRCTCGRRGCAETLIGFRALLAPGQSPEQLARAVQRGEAAACERVQAAGRQLGVLLNNLWVAFDPACILVGGPALRLGNSLLETAERALAAYARDARLTPPPLQACRFGAQAVAVGAAAYVRYRLTRPMAGG